MERGCGDDSEKLSWHDDYESMPYLNAVVKVYCIHINLLCSTSLINANFPLQETLRFHPIVYHIWREATDDDILPLQNPIVTESGETLNELPIPKGQTIACSINGYNRYVFVH